MSNVNTRLDILIDVLDQKLKSLKELLNYTNKQTKILEAEEFDLSAFNKIISKKQEYIDKIINMDDGFKATYEQIKGYIDANPELYKEKIRIMKKAIVEIGDLGIAITVQEGRNKNLFEEKARLERNKMKEFRKSKRTVTNYYSNLNKQKNADGPHFFDSRK